MIVATHLAFATGLYLGGSALFEYPADPISWAITVLFSILPDIDLPTSRVGRPLFWLSVRLEKQHGHRTITHSAIALLVVAGLASPLFSFHRADWYWAMVGGYWSHLWLDMLNMRGIDLFWPASVRVVMPGRPAYRMEVGSKAEMVLMSAFIVWAVAMYPVSQMGLRGGLHQMLKNFDMAFDEYRESAGTRWYSVELSAIDNLSLEHVRCVCPVLGTWKDGLIIDFNGQSRAVGKSALNHNLYPTAAVLEPGAPLDIQTRKVDMQGRSLGWLMDALAGQKNLYLLGELWVDSDQPPQVEDIALYHPVQGSGDRVRLHYARPEDLAGYRRLVAIRGEVMIQGWGETGPVLASLPLGTQAVKVELPKGLQGLF